MSRTSPQPCPLCGARADAPCIFKSKRPYLHDSMHFERTYGEHGAWVDRYDALYRDHDLEFELRQYGRMFP